MKELLGISPRSFMAAILAQTSQHAENDTFSAVYAEWFHQVARWIHALGGPHADLEDVAQDVFLVVRRRLHAFDGTNMGGWLYRITERKVRDFRRRTWFRHLIVGRIDLELAELVCEKEGPDGHLDRRQRGQLLYRVLNRLSEKKRTVFILFELEGVPGPQLAELLAIPLGTVWTRLHHARKDFFREVAKLEARGELK
jgi:RNA polymerase sigma-70 factor, ECF subfamily